MDFGWIISGPGSTWVDEEYDLVKSFRAAGVFHDPARALKELQAKYVTGKDFKWKLHQLKSEPVAYSGEKAWLPY